MWNSYLKVDLLRKTKIAPSETVYCLPETEVHNCIISFAWTKRSVKQMFATGFTNWNYHLTWTVLFLDRYYSAWLSLVFIPLTQKCLFGNVSNFRADRVTYTRISSFIFIIFFDRNCHYTLKKFRENESFLTHDHALRWVFFTAFYKPLLISKTAFSKWS